MDFNLKMDSIFPFHCRYLHIIQGLYITLPFVILNSAEGIPMEVCPGQSLKWIPSGLWTESFHYRGYLKADLDTDASGPEDN